MNYRRFLATLCLSALCCGRVVADETNQTQQLPPTTVTGQLRSAIPQVDSSAATLVSGREVEPGAIMSTRDLTAQAPNVSVFDANNDRTPKFSIRGFRENNFTGGEPVVGVYIDDVPYFDLLSRGLSLYDAQQIDFVRGSQATLYGASGVEGVINIVTRQPEDQWHGYAEASIGNYTAENYQIGAGGALVSNKLYLSINGIYSQRDGYVFNNANNDHPDRQDTLGTRAALTWTPTEQLSVTLSVNAERYNDGFVATYQPGADLNPFSVFRNLNGYVDTSTVNEALKIAYDAGPMKIVSVSSHRDWKQDLLQDFDFSAFPVVNGFSNPKAEQWSEELHVQSADDGEKLRWLTGLYFLSDELQGNSGSVNFPFPPAPTPPFVSTTLSKQQNDTYAMFGQATYTVCDHLDLTAGLRLTYDTREMSRNNTLANPPGPLPSGPAHGSDDFTAALPKLALTWHFTPQFEAYASAAEGYQSGGFNTSVDPGAGTPMEFSPARSWEYELGAKSSWCDNKLTANADLFYTDTKNYQTFRLQPADPTQGFIVNAHSATSFGAEGELAFRPVAGLELNAGLGYTDAQYDRFHDPSTGLNLDGKPISFVPELTANLAAQYTFPWHLYVRAEMIGLGRYHLDDAYNIKSGPTTQSAYELVNARIGYAAKCFDVYFYANNIFDRHYFNNGLNFGGPPNSFPTLILQPGDPTTFGLAAKVMF